MKNIKLEQFRTYMSERSLSAFIVPSCDPHFGEYIQDHFKCLEWISGFNGSAGTVALTINDAALWTDSRYFIQAEEQLHGSGIELKKMRMPGTESVEKWLTDRLEKGAKVGVDANLFSLAEFNSLKEELFPLELVMCQDPFEIVWDGRPALYSNEATLLDETYSGESISSKHRRVVDAIGCSSDFIYLVSVCDDIAWLCNLRGSDIEYNPLVLSYAAVTRDCVILFAAKSAISAELSARLKSEGVRIEDYNYFTEFIGNYPKDSVRIAPREKISVRNAAAAQKNGAIFISDRMRGGVIANLKAVKNNTEIDGFRKAMLMDAIAWVKLWIYMDENLINGDKALSEWDVAAKLIDFRSECNDYLGESFSPISAFGKNGALPHYELSQSSSDIIGNNNFLLVDTGGHYTFGTTDTTRTFAIGTLTQEQKRDYSLVLKGMINLSMARFLKGTRGASLDFLARGPISSAGKIYLHGTGHGIGHRLCVHEGPQSIRMEENPVTIEPGMVMSNEPAVYESGSYGIRLENTILCREWTETQYGTFYQFETLTLIPIDTKPIDKEILGKEGVEWLNKYHSTVYEKLVPYLNETEKKWLAVKTADIH